jgi:hypothetical protein
VQGDEETKRSSRAKKGRGARERAAVEVGVWVAVDRRQQTAVTQMQQREGERSNTAHSVDGVQKTGRRVLHFEHGLAPDVAEISCEQAQRSELGVVE